MQRKIIKLSREHKKLVGTFAIKAYQVLKQGLVFPCFPYKVVRVIFLCLDINNSFRQTEREAIDTDFFTTFSSGTGKKAYITASR